jgi:transcriptional regulator with XRE-family HTH domain
MNADFAKAIHALRMKKNLSQRRVAEELGISQALLSHYENGVREPKLPFVKRICDYYEVSADYVLGVGSGGGRDSGAENGEDAAIRLLTDCLKEAEKVGGGALGLAAAEYICAAVMYCKFIIENPEAPYDPKFSIDIRIAESALYAAARDIKHTGDKGESI